MRLHALAASVPFVFLIAIGACVGDDPSVGPGTDPTQEGGSPTMTDAMTCGPGNACANGAPCVDGYCCNAACSGVCEACNVAGQEGKCTPVSGKPHHGMCDGEQTGVCAGSCDGANRAACSYPTVACGSPASCAGGTATLPSTCKAGTCPAAATQLCALGCLEDGCLGVKQLAAGYYHACAVLTDKHVRCWGSNTFGQTGQDPSTTVVKMPMQVPSLSNVEAIAATFDSSCALLADKTVRCWGSNNSGELGNGLAVDAMQHPTPTAVAGLTDVIFLAGSSSGHYCAIVTGGAVKCWGTNGSGELGDGTTGAPKSAPVTACQPGTTPPTCNPSTGATFVAGGDSHTCAVFAGGKVACWGSNSNGEIGQTPDAVKHAFPAFVANNLTATYLTAGNRITCAASAGGAKCFGANGSGRLGNGQDNGDTGTPAAVCTKADCSTQLTNVTAVTTFDESSCALAGGAVKCWGINTGGQLGDGNATASQNYAATTAIASGVVAVASGGGANYAIVVDRANRDVRCWGNEGSNQCGDGLTTMDRKTPIAPKW